MSDDARLALCAGLDEERIAVVEERIGAELRLGLHHQSIGERVNPVAAVAHALAHQARLESAETSIEAALTIIGETGERLAEAFALNVRGRLTLRAGRPQAARTDHRAALDWPARRGPYPEVESLVGLAEAACAAHRFGDSVSCAEAALAIAERAGFRILAGYALTALATALAHEGDQCLAIERATTAVALHRESGCRLGETRALVTLGHVLASTDPAAASDHDRAAQAFFHTCGAVAPPMTWRPVTTFAGARARA